MILPEADPKLSAEYHAKGWWRNETLIDDLRNLAETRPDDVVIVSYRAETGSVERVTFGQLWMRVNATALGLCDLGIEPRDVVSFQLPNCWQFTVLYLACARIGAIAHPIPIIHRAHEVELALQRVESRVSVTATSFRGHEYARMHEQMLGKVPSLEHVLVVGATQSRKTESFSARCLQRRTGASELAVLDTRPTHGDDPEIIKFTSGTTGEPKGVVHSHNTLYSATSAALTQIGLHPNDTVLSPSPMAHMTGLLCGVLMPSIGGLKVVLLDIWDPLNFMKLTENERASVTWGVPAYWVDVLNTDARHEYNLDSLSIIVCSGSPIPRSLAKRIENTLQVEFRPDWGMTETAGVTFVGPGAKPEARLATDGRATPEMELKVVDARGAVVPNGAEGRLLVRGPSRFLGYLARPDLTTAVVDGDGWLDSGDLATIDAEGYVRISGRSKDIIIRGGENLPVVEIEDALYRMTQISEVAVVGYPDERLGERAAAIVIPRTRDERLTLTDIQRHLACLGIAKHYWPEKIKLVDEMPRTDSGKIQKYLLRAMLAAETSTESTVMQADAGESRPE